MARPPAHRPEISARVAPWANWWWGPTIEGDWRAPTDGSDRHPGGLALARSAVIMLTTAGAPTWTVRAAYHEAFHVLDDWLTLDERRVLDAAVDRGPTWPTPYLSSRVERRARLFEGFAMYLHEGGSVIVGSRTPEARILAAAYDGPIGALALARQRQPRRLPRWLGWRGNVSSTTTTVSPSVPSSLTKSRTG